MTPGDSESFLNRIILPLFTHHYVVPNLYFTSVDQKRFVFEEYPGRSIQYNESGWDWGCQTSNLE